jgi:hypothetical protein
MNIGLQQYVALQRTGLIHYFTDNKQKNMGLQQYIIVQMKERPA